MTTNQGTSPCINTPQRMKKSLITTQTPTENLSASIRIHLCASVSDL